MPIERQARQRKRLTEAKIKAIKPTGKLARYPDGESLLLEVSAAGNMSWYLRFRVEGKANRKCLGRYPVVDLEAARKAALDVRKYIWDEKANPNLISKKEKLQAAIAKIDNSFAACAARRMAKAESTNEWSDTHFSRNTYLLREFLVPAFGKRPIGEITASELREVIEAIVASGTWEYIQA